MKYFYSHLIEIESILVELDKLDLKDEQKVHLTSLIDSSLHHTILDAILSQLSDSDKRVFMSHVTNKKEKEIWELLNSRVDKVEEKIKKAAQELKTKMHEDIKELKK